MSAIQLNPTITSRLALPIKTKSNMIKFEDLNRKAVYATYVE